MTNLKFIYITLLYFTCFIRQSLLPSRKTTLDNIQDYKPYKLLLITLIGSTLLIHSASYRSLSLSICTEYFIQSTQYGNSTHLTSFDFKTAEPPQKAKENSE